VCFSSPEEAEHVETWLAHLTSPKLSLTPQLQSQDLGARLHHALTQAFAAGHRRAVVVGTDVPDLNQTILERALKALDDHDAVFGPAEDGGYYLMGIRATPEAGLFEGMQWSTSEVLQQSVAAAERCGLSVAQLGTLPTLPDIDTAQDLEIWCKSAGSQTPGDPLVTLARRLLTSALHEPPKEQEPP